MELKKFSHLRIINQIQRKNNSSLERSNYFRLDKNERIVKFEDLFMKNIKKGIKLKPANYISQLKKSI